MNTNQLRVFITLSEGGNFHTAAKLLFLTPPAVKSVLDSLESETGLVLFARSRTGLELTESGELFADYASRALAVLNEGVSLAASASADERQKIDAPWMVMVSMIKDTLFQRAYAAFKEGHPSIDVTFRHVKSLIGEHYDVINGFADVVHTHAVAHPLTDLPVWCAVAKDGPLSSRRSVSFEDLASYELLLPVQEIVDRMDEGTRLFLGSKGEASARMDVSFIESDLYPWCLGKGHAAVLVGRWPQADPASYSLVEFVPLAGSSFQYCMFTQEHPTSAVSTYIAFMQDFYAHEVPGM